MIRDKFEPVNLTKATLNTLLEKYLSQMNSYSESTIKTYRKTLKDFYQYYENSSTFLFMPSDVEKYIEYLRERGLKDNSVKTYITSLRKFFQFLTDGFILEKNPVKRVNIRNIKTAVPHSILSDEDIQILLWTLSADDPASIRDRLIVSLILYCGFSYEELLNIKRSQIEMKRKYWYINTDFPINHELNNNAVPKYAVDILKAFWESELHNDTEYLFVSYSNKSNKKQLTQRGLNVILKNRLMNAGFDGKRMKMLTPSDLRKTSISLAIRNGARVNYIMKRYKIKLRSTLEKYR